MPKYVAKHRIEGLSKKAYEPGQTCEAPEEDVKDMLAEKHGGNVKSEDFAAVAPASSAEAKIAEGEAKEKAEAKK